MPNDVLTLPERAGSRADAQTVLSAQPSDLHGVVLRLDGHLLGSGSSSFIDELVKEVLVERRADGLVMDLLTERAAAFARASATRRGVTGRLSVTHR